MLEEITTKAAGRKGKNKYKVSRRETRYLLYQYGKVGNSS